MESWRQPMTISFLSGTMHVAGPHLPQILIAPVCEVLWLLSWTDGRQAPASSKMSTWSSGATPNGCHDSVIRPNATLHAPTHEKDRWARAYWLTGGSSIPWYPVYCYPYFSSFGLRDAIAFLNTVGVIIISATLLSSVCRRYLPAGTVGNESFRDAPRSA